MTGPARASGSPKGKTSSTGATGPGAGGHAKTTHTAHAEAVRGGGDNPVGPGSDEPTTPPKGHAHAGSGNSGNGAEASPRRPAHAPKRGGTAPRGRGAGAGAGTDWTVPDATKRPNSAHGTTGAAAASSGAHPAKSDAPKMRAAEANNEDGSGADSS